MKKTPTETDILFRRGVLMGIVFLICQILIIRYAQAGVDDNFKEWKTTASVMYFVTGVPVSVQLAQAFCETNFGQKDEFGYYSDGVQKYRDTVGYHFNNIFAIMDFENDYWKAGYGWANGCWGLRRYRWRVYLCPMISWIDHAYFLAVHNQGHRFKNWRYWCDNPIRYGRRGYWEIIRETIIKYELYKYDWL